MQEKQRAFLVRTAYWTVWAVLLWLGVRYLLRWLLPFLLALALAAAVEPVIAWCRRRMGLKRGFTAAVVTIAVTGAILALAAVIVWQLIRQAAELLGQLPGLLAGLPGMTENLRQRLEDFCAACPQGLRSWLEEVPALLGTLAAGVAQRASGACITAAAARAAAAVMQAPLARWATPAARVPSRAGTSSSQLRSPWGQAAQKSSSRCRRFSVMPGSPARSPGSCPSSSAA